MTLRVPAARLLPLTITVMAALLGVKSVALVRAAVPAPGAAPAAAAMVAAAQAATPPQPATASPPAPAQKPAAATPDAADNAEAKPPTPTSGPGIDPVAAGPPVSDSERALLLDLRHRSVELDARASALDQRDAVLAAAETRLAARVVELTALQTRLEALEAARTQRDETNWNGLVKLYESMKPRDAATIFNDLDLPVLLQVVDRMKDAKAAAVLAAMLPERARLVTAQLAALRSRANTLPAVPKAGG
jgi:flagellar motility protein MotE (MotC chaperone)